MTPYSVMKLITESGKDLLLSRCQAIIWTNCRFIINKAYGSTCESMLNDKENNFIPKILFNTQPFKQATWTQIKIMIPYHVQLRLPPVISIYNARNMPVSGEHILCGHFISEVIACTMLYWIKLYHNITLKSHDGHGTSNHQQLNCLLNS